MATNRRREAFDSCKLSVYIWLLGALPLDHTGVLPMDLAVILSSPRLRVPTLTSEPGYAIAAGTVAVCLPSATRFTASL